MDIKKTQAVLIGIIAILAIAVVGLLVTRRGDDRPRVEQFKYADNQPRQGMMKTEVNQEKTGVPAKGNMMQAQVPADLTVDQTAQLKAGIADHTPGELTFNVTGGSFYFTPNEIRVKQGDKVKIIFTNAGGMHNFILDAYNVKTQTIQTGASETVEFTADKKGTFEFYCGVGNGYHRQKGQVGVLLVE